MEDQKYLDVNSLGVKDLRTVLSKYGVVLGTEAQNKSFLKKLYKENDVSAKIRQRQEEDMKRNLSGRKRTIEMVENPPKVSPAKKQKRRRSQTTSKSPKKKPGLNSLVDQFAPVPSFPQEDTEMEDYDVPSASQPIKQEQIKRTPNNIEKNPRARPIQVNQEQKQKQRKTKPIISPTGQTFRERKKEAQEELMGLLPSVSVNSVTTQVTPTRITPTTVNPFEDTNSPAFSTPNNSNMTTNKYQHSSERRRPQQRTKRRRKVSKAEEVEEEDDESDFEQYASIFKWIVILVILLAGIAGGFYLINKPLPFCGSGHIEEPGVCIRCPTLGYCEHNSFSCQCPSGYVLSNDRSSCIEDLSIPMIADQLLATVLKPILEKQSADYICGRVDSPEVSEKEIETILRFEYGKIATQDVMHNDYHLVFRHIVTMLEHNNIYRRKISENNFVMSSTDSPRLDLSCSLQVFWNEQKIWIVLGSVVLSIIGFQVLVYIRKKQLAEEVRLRLERQRELDPQVPGVSIYALRDEFCKHYSRFSLNYFTWKAVCKDLAHDSRVSETSQLVGHEQKLMWEWND